MNNNALKKELVEYLIKNHRLVSIIEKSDNNENLQKCSTEVTIAHGKTLRSKFVFDYHLGVVEQEIHPKTRASHYTKFASLLKFAEEKHKQMLSGAQAWHALEKIADL